MKLNIQRQFPLTMSKSCGLMDGWVGGRVGGWVGVWVDRQTDRQTGRQAGRQPASQPASQPDRQTDRQTDRYHLQRLLLGLQSFVVCCIYAGKVLFPQLIIKTMSESSRKINTSKHILIY